LCPQAGGVLRHRRVALGAEIEVHSVMVLEDLGKATPEIERVAQKYG
jgi:hypothetical protein